LKKEEYIMLKVHSHSMKNVSFNIYVV